MDKTKPTPGPWRFKGRTLTVPHLAVYGPPHLVDGGDYAPICEPHYEADARLIVAAVNACFQVNPDNPLAVAEALPELVEAARTSVDIADVYPRSTRHALGNALAKTEA